MPEIKTKEQYLQEVMNNQCTCHEIYSSRKMVDPDCIYCNYWDDVIGAMDEYAKQESAEFFKWYGVKMAGFIEYIKDIRPIVTSNEIEEKIKEFEGKFISELYNLYLESKNKIIP